MGFNGGGGGQLLNHRHDGSLVADGGPLSFLNITQSGMSAGSITQSDGAHLQELVIGNPDDALRVNAAATAVEYHTPVTGSLELLGSETLAATGANVTLTGTWNISDYTAFIVTCGFSNDNSAGTPDLRFRINNQSAAVYVTNMILNTGGVLSATTSGMATSGLLCTSNVCPPSSTETCETTLTLELSVQNPNSTFRWNWSNTPMWSTLLATPADTEQITSVFNNNFQNQLTQLDFYFSDASNFRIGSNIYLYGILRT